MRTNQACLLPLVTILKCRKETTLWKRWEPEKNSPNLVKLTVMSEGNYSLKEMRTQPHQYLVRLNHFYRRKETTLWKRWEQKRAVELALSIITTVGRKLLSERDENQSNLIDALLLTITRRKETTLWKRWELFLASWHSLIILLCRKETTLWKRWEHFILVFCYHIFVTLSEGNYSLKEMRTNIELKLYNITLRAVGRKLLSERDENISVSESVDIQPINSSEGNYSLKEMRTTAHQSNGVRG